MMFSSVLEIALGVVTMWSGAIGNIPPGWSLCDGSNGTPDMRDKFEVGAGTTYSPGDTGGGGTHDHTFTGAGHVHDVNFGAGVSVVGDREQTVDSTALAGTTDAASSLPPYYALAYIQFTG